MIYLLLFLLILGIGIGIILRISKGMKNFWAMAGWSMFAYLAISFITLLIMADQLHIVR